MAGRAEEGNVHQRASLTLAAALLLACAACGGPSARPAGPTAAASASAEADAEDGGPPRAHDKLACPEHVEPKKGHTLPAPGPDTIAVVHVTGNARVVKHDICKAIASRAGETYDADKIASDLHALWASRDFDDVQASRGSSPSGTVVTFVVHERPIVSEVRIDGNAIFDFDTLRKLVPVQTGDAADPADVHDATAALTAFYVSKGYRSAQIDYTLEPDTTAAGHAAAHFHVSEGKKAIISAFTFSGLSVATDAELRSLLDTQDGTIDAVGGLYADDVLAHDLLTVQAHLYDRGLLEARIDPPVLTLSADGSALAVVIPIHEGPVYKLDVIHITGNDLAGDEKALLKVFALQKGDVFSRSKVLDAITKLKAYQALKKKPVRDIEPKTDLHPDTATVDLTIQMSS